ncbi:MAG: hypothetical protein U9O78_04930 [Patescibacteria group bacterium]|nr:hypothetical protein [Patescibacteria group bacterium]
MKKIKKVVFSSVGALTATAMSASPALAQLGEVAVPSQGYAANIGGLISGLLNLVMVIAAILVFLYLIWGGIEWITSGGDKSKTESARNKITSAVIGLVVLTASYALLQLALNFLGFSGGINDVFDNMGSING